MKPKPIAVTGMGCVTPCGNNTAALWESLTQGRSGIDYVTRLDLSAFKVKIGGELKDFDPQAFGVAPKDASRLDPFAHFALAAATEAIADSGLELTPAVCDEAATIIGTGMGGIGTIEKQHALLLERGPGRVSPFLVPGGVPDVAANEISLKYKLMGPAFGVTTACSSATDAIIAAARVILDDGAKVVVAGGTEAPMSGLAFSAFANMRALSRRPCDPKEASCPFDLRRDGFVLGEGAGVLVLEDYDFARARGARIRALLAGYGQSADAHHKTAPDPEGTGAAKAMHAALARAGLAPTDIHYMNAHGTSTKYNDLAETIATRRVFGDYAYRVPMSSTKSMTGHMIGAAGAVEAIVCILAMESGVVPPTINLHSPDPACDLNYVPNEAVRADVRAAMSNTFGFGGHNACVVFTREEG
jgi:3-oxoacyl-[acyl-carrier-protein] synthase II